MQCKCFCSRLASKEAKRENKNEDKEKRREDFLIEKGKKKERGHVSRPEGGQRIDK